MTDQGHLAQVRAYLDNADIDEIVRWQLTGILHKKAPVHRSQPRPRCHNCHGDWHGLPFGGCPGSYADTPSEDHS